MGGLALVAIGVAGLAGLVGIAAVPGVYGVFGMSKALVEQLTLQRRAVWSQRAKMAPVVWDFPNPISL